VVRYFLLLTSINLLLAFVVSFAFLINVSANKQIKWDFYSLLRSASLHNFSKL